MKFHNNSGDYNRAGYATGKQLRFFGLIELSSIAFPDKYEAEYGIIFRFVKAPSKIRDN
jgi:hypothetical protein